MIELDGSLGEGGGQMLRTALGLSVVTKMPFTMKNIRLGRSSPGLKAEHLCCIKILEHACGCKSKGATLGSTSIAFTPGTLVPGIYGASIGTAGSISLVMQSLLLPSIVAQGKVAFSIKGGTDVKWAQPIDYLIHVLLPHLSSYAQFETKVTKRGYFPKGQGGFDIMITPRQSKDPLVCTQLGQLQSIQGISHAHIDLKEAKVAERQRESVLEYFKHQKQPVSIELDYQETASVGSGITLWATQGESIVGADALGERGKKAEIVGKGAATSLEESLKFPVDHYLADNLIPYLGLFGGTLRTSQLTKHCTTNIDVCELFLGKRFKVNGETGTITVENGYLNEVH